MSIEKIQMDIEELLDVIQNSCNECGIESNINREKTPMHIEISKGDKESVLRIYQKKNGLKIDTSVGSCSELNKEVEQKFNEISNYKETEQRTYTYKKVNKDQIYKILKDIDLMLDEQIVLIEKENKDPNKSHFMEIINNITKESMVLSVFNNGTICVQGIVWTLWEDICQIIERNISIAIPDIVDRFLLDEKQNMVDKDDFTQEEADVKVLIGEDVYNYLDEHYQDYLVSAQCIVTNNVKMREYSTVLCPTAKVLEGYLKKILIDLKLEKKLKMNDTWNFGQIFNKDEIIIRYGDVSITETQKNQLINIYKLVKYFRHNINHGSPKPKLIVKTLELCKYHYEKILKEINRTYYLIYK